MEIQRRPPLKRKVKEKEMEEEKETQEKEKGRGRETKSGNQFPNADPTGKYVCHSEDPPPQRPPEKQFPACGASGFDVKIPQKIDFGFLEGFYASMGANFYVKMLRRVSCVDL